MVQRQIEGIDTYGFPEDLLEHSLLAYMGDDYIRYITVELLKRFRQQDDNSEMLAIKCEERPQLLTRVDENTGTVQSIVVNFNLQVLLQASDGQYWRLRGDCKFSGVGRDQSGQISTSLGFDIRSAEQVM